MSQGLRVVRLAVKRVNVNRERLQRQHELAIRLKRDGVYRLFENGQEKCGRVGGGAKLGKSRLPLLGDCIDRPRSDGYRGVVFCSFLMRVYIR